MRERRCTCRQRSSSGRKAHIWWCVPSCLLTRWPGRDANAAGDQSRTSRLRSSSRFRGWWITRRLRGASLCCWWESLRDWDCFWLRWESTASSPMSVTRQTQEIGIRMALGATQTRVQLDVIWKTLRLALIGIAVGVVASLAVARLIASLLFRTAPTDPLTFAGDGDSAGRCRAAGWISSCTKSFKDRSNGRAADKLNSESACISSRFALPPYTRVHENRPRSNPMDIVQLFRLVIAPSTSTSSPAPSSVRSGVTRVPLRERSDSPPKKARTRRLWT